ncbi:alternate-type signal peptide domain-containing protein [Nocardioides sp.]|uniref:alternate-type signal peptide domain-containing protein n=1 Tax=Nocardioides sp. TaxID=35761 RepID=UPI003D09C5B2
MKKSTKGALAAGAAGVLLMGGAGSLAYWTATGTANGGSITSGSLSLTNGSCDSAWKYASGTAAGSTASLVVPGDSITKSCTFTVGATGDHLTAKLTAPGTLAYTKTPAGATTDSLNVASTYQINRSTPATLVNGDVLTSSDNGKVITAKFVVTMPYGSATVNANDTQGLTATLNQLTVTLTQDQSSGNNPNA